MSADFTNKSMDIWLLLLSDIVTSRKEILEFVNQLNLIDPGDGGGADSAIWGFFANSSRARKAMLLKLCDN